MEKFNYPLVKFLKTDEVVSYSLQNAMKYGYTLAIQKDGKKVKKLYSI